MRTGVKSGRFDFRNRVSDWRMSRERGRFGPAKRQRKRYEQGFGHTEDNFKQREGDKRVLSSISVKESYGVVGLVFRECRALGERRVSAQKDLTVRET